MEREEWYDDTFLLVLAILFIPPLGFYGLFRRLDVSPLVSILLVLLIAGGSAEGNGFRCEAEMDSEDVSVSKTDPVAPNGIDGIEVDSTK